jgi:8-oxo-dGTP diphosphatase
MPVAVHLLLAERGRLLMLRRYNTGYADGSWSVPAGHLDGKEPVTAAMVREAFEETRLVLDPAALNLAHVMHRSAEDVGSERVDFFFTATRWTGSPVIAEPDKCDDLGWFDLDDLPADTVPYVAAAVAAAGRWQCFSEFGWKDQS